MSTPKYIESPNSVQTSLYGYDRHKRVQFQVNNLRGKPIVVLRSDTVNSGIGSGGGGGGPRSPRKWVDRSHQMPPPIPSKPMYPSYAHFHHQYACPKPTPLPNISNLTPSSPSSLLLGSPLSPSPFTHTAHERSPRHFKTRGESAPSSPKPRTPKNGFRMFNGPSNEPETEAEANSKRVFDKLAVSLPSPTSSAPYSNIVTDVTLLELNPKMNQKTFVTGTSSLCASSETEDSSSSSASPCPPSFLLDTPRSLSHSRRTSCSEQDALETENEAENEEIGEVEVENRHPIDDPNKPKVHTCPDEKQCQVFRDGVCVNHDEERKAVLQWYDDLIQWRHDVVTRKRFGPPRCHPPPLTITIIGASRAQRANPFHRVKDVHPFAMEAMDHARRKMDARRSHHLIPANLPLPAPHEFMYNAKCLEPHLFIEYCYQLTAAAYIDTGLNPPHRRPPIPPRIEPIPEQPHRETLCSSASEISSDGEYSDDSDGTKTERLRQKMERHTKREHRLREIFRRRRQDDKIDEEDD